MSIFTSKREEEGSRLFDDQIQSFDSIMKDINSLKGIDSKFDGISSVSDIGKKFGITSFNRPEYNATVSSVFDPKRRALANRLGKARSAGAARLAGGSSAMPAVEMAPIESQYGDAFATLDSEQAGQELAGFDKERSQNNYLGEFLRNIMGNQDTFATGQQNFGLNKMGMRLNANNAKTNAINGYLQSQDSESTFDDILGVVSTGAKVASGLGWAPFK